MDLLHCEGNDFPDACISSYRWRITIGRAYQNYFGKLDKFSSWQDIVQITSPDIMYTLLIPTDSRHSQNKLTIGLFPVKAYLHLMVCIMLGWLLLGGGEITILLMESFGWRIFLGKGGT